MSTSLILRVLWLRPTLRQREGGATLTCTQTRSVPLRLYESSPTRGRPSTSGCTKGLEGAPLEELPVLTNATLMDNFDQLSSDPALCQRRSKVDPVATAEN